MVWPLLRNRRGLLAALIGATVCLATIPVLPIGVPILCASVGVLVGLPAERPGERATSAPELA